MASGARLVDRVRRRGDLPVVLCIDVEPDPRSFNRGDRPPWSGFERFIELIPALRDRLSSITGAPAVFTWTLRMDPQVAETWGSPSWVAETYADEFAEFVARGDQLALHTHTWRMNRDSDRWIADYEDEAWTEHCLASSFDAFESVFGRPCVVHRAGDRFLSRSMVRWLEDSAVEVDLTVEPGAPPGGHGPGLTVGSQTDFTDAPRNPYRTTAASFPDPDPDGEGLLMLPLFSPYARSHGHRLPLWPDRGKFVPRLALEMLLDPPQVLATVARSDAAVRAWDQVEANLDHLGHHRGVRFVTASEAVRLLERDTANGNGA